MPSLLRLSARVGAVVLSLGIGWQATAQEFSLNALADLRLVVPSNQRSWMEGGLGKLRFDGGGHQTPQLDLGQIVADGRFKLGSDFLAFFSVRYVPEQKVAVDLLEAYARYQPIQTSSWLWSIKAGAFFPPVSLENEGIGWTSPWTITPSAINSWVGDELRTIGGETTLEWRFDTGSLGFTGAVFGKNDPAGALIADRGWTFGDRPTGLFDRARLPDQRAAAVFRRPPLWLGEFQEIDDSPGWYGGISWRQDDIGLVRVLRYDNRANPAASRDGQFAWRTEFNSIGVETYFGDFVLIGQGMTGETEINPGARFRSITHFQSGYALVGRYFGNWSAAARAEVFATQERPGPNHNSDEHGYALTLAANWGPVRWFRLGAEAMRVDSYRVQRQAAGLPPRAIEHQIQLMARFVY